MRLNRDEEKFTHLQKRAVIHEMMHAAGFYHEHTRPDRDEYVEIIWDNIQDGMESQFEKGDERSQDTKDIPYDYGSVMHYGGNVSLKMPKI